MCLRGHKYYGSFYLSYQQGIGGSVVEFSPATREARARFPANASCVCFFAKYVCMNNYVTSMMYISTVSQPDIYMYEYIVMCSFSC